MVAWIDFGSFRVRESRQMSQFHQVMETALLVQMCLLYFRDRSGFVSISNYNVCKRNSLTPLIQCWTQTTPVLKIQRKRSERFPSSAIDWINLIQLLPCTSNKDSSNVRVPFEYWTEAKKKEIKKARKPHRWVTYSIKSPSLQRKYQLGIHIEACSDQWEIVLWNRISKHNT